MARSGHRMPTSPMGAWRRPGCTRVGHAGVAGYCRSVPPCETIRSSRWMIKDFSGAGMVLRDLGLDAVTEEVYRTLLEEPNLEAGSIADQLGLSQTDVMDALDALAD